MVFFMESLSSLESDKFFFVVGFPQMTFGLVLIGTTCSSWLHQLGITNFKALQKSEEHIGKHTHTHTSHTHTHTCTIANKNVGIT